MIPYILAGLGGYLIGDSFRKKYNPLSNPYNILKDGGIMADGGELIVDERLSMLSDELKKHDIYSFVTKDINKIPFVYVGTDEQYITNIVIYINKNGKYQLEVNYHNHKEKEEPFKKIEDVLKYLMENYNLTKSSSVEALRQSRSSKKIENEWISPRERVKKYGYKDGGKTKSRDGETKWIQRAIKKPGALRAEAKKQGLIKGDEKLSKADLDKLEKEGGKTAQRARLAKTLKKLD